MASMVPVSGSAYTYTYGVLGELLASLAGPDHLLGREPWLAIAPAAA